MKKKFLKLTVVFVFAALLICALALSTSAASDKCANSADGNHLPGRAASCLNPRLCMLCGEILEPQRDHAFNTKPTCGEGAVCLMCGEIPEGYEALGYEFCEGNISAATCLDDKRCKVCERLMEKAHGHNAVGTVDCGHSVNCSVCFQTLEDKSGNHTLDWANATIVREATDDTPGIAEVKCTVCQTVREHMFNTVMQDDEGLASIGTTADVMGATLKVDTLASADFAGIKLAKKHGGALQAFRLGLERDGAVFSPSGARVVTMALNRNAKAADDLRVFSVKGDGSYEEMTVVTVEGGNVQFETSLFSDARFIIIDGAVEAGLSTGALIGIIAGGAAVVVAAVAIVLVVVLRKKKPEAAE